MADLSAEQILKARQLARAGKTAVEIREALGLTLKPESVRTTLRKYSINVRTAPRRFAHLGDETRQSR